VCQIIQCPSGFAVRRGSTVTVRVYVEEKQWSPVKGPGRRSPAANRERKQTPVVQALETTTIHHRQDSSAESSDAS